MVVEIIGLYGMSDREKGYYRKTNTSYEFVAHKSRATVLTKEQAEVIMANKEAYLKKYQARDIRVIT